MYEESTLSGETAEFQRAADASVAALKLMAGTEPLSGANARGDNVFPRLKLNETPDGSPDRSPLLTEEEERKLSRVSLDLPANASKADARRPRIEDTKGARGSEVLAVLRQGRVKEEQTRAGSSKS